MHSLLCTDDPELVFILIISKLLMRNSYQIRIKLISVMLVLHLSNKIDFVEIYQEKSREIILIMQYFLLQKNIKLSPNHYILIELCRAAHEKLNSNLTIVF